MDQNTAAMTDTKAFRVKRMIRFFHCDPAGIVYYPEYFNMFQSLVEDWFNQALEINYADFISNRRLGLPTVRIECEFLLPSRIGETISLILRVKRIGRSSIALAITGMLGEEIRLQAHVTLVTTSLETHRAIPIPQDLLQRLTDYQHSTEGEQ